MTLLRVLLMSIALIASVQSFPSTTRDYENEPAAVLETKESTDSIPVHTEEPQTMFDIETTSEGELSMVEFALKSPKEGLGVRKGSTQEKYVIAHLPTKNKDKNLNLLDIRKDNEIDIDGKDKSHELNNTGLSKSKDLLPAAQIKRDQWLFDPQEKSSIMGKMPQYFYDAIKPIPPFPELSETAKPIYPSLGLSETAKPKETLHELLRKSYESLELGGPLLYPKSALIREIDVSFFGDYRK